MNSQNSSDRLTIRCVYVGMHSQNPSYLFNYAIDKSSLTRDKIKEVLHPGLTDKYADVILKADEYIFIEEHIMGLIELWQKGPTLGLTLEEFVSKALQD